MYENEYDTERKSTTTPLRNGTYTDYASYSRARFETDSETTEKDIEPDFEFPKKRKKAKPVLACIALVLVGLIVGGVVTGAYLNSRYNAKSAQTGQDVAQGGISADDTNANDDTLEGDDSAEGDASDRDTSDATLSDNSDQTVSKTVTSNQDLTVADIAAMNLSCVVAITNKGVKEVQSMWGNFAQQSQSAGSGIIVGETDSELLIVTNYHVVANSSELSVVFSWEEITQANDADIITAEVKDYDANRDIAVIAINMEDLSDEIISRISIATIGSSDELVLGEQVVAIGNALGYGQSVTTGIVSALNRKLEMSSLVDSSKTVTNTFIQTDAAINPGNSGGALFNMRGELIGINSAKYGSSSVEGTGYAIPISEVTEEIKSMMNKEARQPVDEANRGYLGITIADVTSDISATYNMPRGIYISAINPGSAAEIAGLEVAEIITGIEGKTIVSSSEFKSYLAYYAVGDTVTITVAHANDGEYVYRDVQVVLGR